MPDNKFFSKEGILPKNQDYYKSHQKDGTTAEIYASYAASAATVEQFVVVFTMQLRLITDTVEDLYQNESLAEAAVNQVHNRISIRTSEAIPPGGKGALP